MRDNKYLEEKLNFLWDKFFTDVPRSNKVLICFGKKAVKRLGSIRKSHSSDKENFDTLIYINGHFKDRFIPDSVVEATIIHELCHYAHGFSSPLPQLSKFPHRGDMVDRELEKRGLKTLDRTEKEWLNKYWQRFIKNTTS